MKRPKKSLLLLTIVFLNLSIIFLLRADTVVQRSLESVIKNSEIIAFGKIIELYPSKKYPYLNCSLAKFKVETFIKGGKNEEYIWIEGCLNKEDNENIDSYGIAKFYKNESAIVFLIKNGKEYEIYGAYQGKFSIKNNIILNSEITISDFITSINKVLVGTITNIRIFNNPYSKNTKNLRFLTYGNFCGTENRQGPFWWDSFPMCIPSSGKSRWPDNITPTIKINPTDAKYKQGGQIINLTFNNIRNAVSRVFGYWAASGTYMNYNISSDVYDGNFSCDNGDCVIAWTDLLYDLKSTISDIRKTDGYTSACNILFSRNHYWNLDDPGFPNNCLSDPSNIKDFDRYAAHEIGHFWGLGHIQNNSSPLSVLFPNCQQYYGITDGDLDGRVFLNPQISGYFYNQSTWCGGSPASQIHVVGNVTIPSGSTLTIQPGAIVKFYNGASLNVYGTLNANGTSSNRIIFQSGDGSAWGGIKIYSNNVSMSYCKIQNATTGIYIQSASPSIQWTWINNSTYGISVNGGTSSFTSNTLAYNSSAGLTSYNSANVLMNNYARNVITGSYTGIYSVNGGYISAFNGYNSIYSCSGYLATAGNNGNIMADGNYWGQCPPPSSWFYGNVTYTNSVCPDPNAGRALQKHNSIMEFNPPAALNNQQSDDLGEIYKNWQEKDYTSVKTKSKALINLSSEKNIKYQAIIMYRAACQMTNDTEIEQYLLELEKIYNGDELGGMALLNNALYSMNRQKYQEALIKLERAIKQYPGTDIEKSALFEKIIILNNHLEDKINGDNEYQKFSERYKDDFLFGQLNLILDKKPENFPEKDNFISKKIAEENIVLSCYPNPFNPSTRINFEVKSSGNVTLKIYDILGKEISTLISEYKEKGTYSVEFRPENIPSGIYYAKISANGIEKNLKLMYIK